MASVAAVAEKLGGRKVFRRSVTSEAQFISAIRAGLPATALDSIIGEFAAVAGIQADIYRAVGSARTLQRKRTMKRSLSADESDRLARVARLLVRAEEALGDRERAHRWFVRSNRALEGQRPLALLDSDIGALAVERLLGRIEHGLYS